MYFRSLKLNVMRYFIFTILLVVPLLLTAQSKKEQIATLNLKVDSLFEVLVNNDDFKYCICKSNEFKVSVDIRS
jgi:hypothetical protein